jgi:hypothetical protein
MDLLYGHEYSAYVLVTLQQKEGIGSDIGPDLAGFGVPFLGCFPVMG